jgi:hypothetical protein
MKNPMSNPTTQLGLALHALKEAILQGATSRYEKLVALALQAGATDEQIDLVAHEAIEVLFARAEQPITPSNLGQLWGANRPRRQDRTFLNRKTANS